MAEKKGGKLETKERLLSSAEELFSADWYETVSVAEICRNASLANGSFYRYFSNKEDIFRELLEYFLEQFRLAYTKLSGATLDQRLHSFIRIMLDVGVKFRNHVTIFREGQYRFPEYERMLKDLYLDALVSVYQRSLSEAEYIYITAGLRFISIRSLYDDLETDILDMKEIILNGLLSGREKISGEIFSSKIRYPEEGDEKTSRQKLLQSGIELFGRKGYYPVSVYDIAKDAGFSVGTFYLYFPGKEQFLLEIIEMIGDESSRFMRNNHQSGSSRAELEISRMFLFVCYYGRHSNFYEIRREAEFVIKDKIKEYYDGLESVYLSDLSGFRDFNPLIIANFLIGLSHYLGIELLFGDKDYNPEELIMRIGNFLLEGISE